MESPQLKIYSSSAGSGKTYTLVREFLAIILSNPHPADYRHILAMTFTNKAAGEMKSRVIGALHTLSSLPGQPRYDEVFLTDIAEHTSLDEPTVQERSGSILHHMLHHYSDISISTIDKFLHRIIRSFSRELGVPMDFQVQIDNEDIITQAVDELLQEAGNDKEITRALKGYVQYRIAENKDYRLENDLKAFAKTLMREDAQTAKELLAHIDIDRVLELRKEMRDMVRSFESELANYGKKAMDLVAASGLETGHFTNKESGPIGFYINIIDPPKTYQYEFEKSRIQKAVHEDKWYTKNLTPEIKQRIDGIKEDLRQFYLEAEKLYQQEYGTYKLYQELSKRIYALAIAKVLLRNLDGIREQEGIMMISDFNERIGEVIRSEPIPFVYERAGTRYHHFLLDEFQDTSALQWQNIAPLLADSLSKGKSNLIVGDSKQAIYRWRNGDVEQFLDLPKIPGSHIHSSLKDHESILMRHKAIHVLGSNYRSGREIVGFNNWFFQSLVDENQSQFKTAYSSISQEVQRDFSGYVQVKTFNRSAEIEEIQKKVLEVVLNAKERGMAYREMAILTRSNKEGSLLARYLLRQGIPVLSQDSLLITHQPGIRLLESVLQWITERDNEHKKARVIHWYCKVHGLDETDSFSKFTTLVKGESDYNEVQIDVAGFLAGQGTHLDLDLLSSRPLVEMVIDISRSLNLNEFNDPFVQQFLEQISLMSTPVAPSLNEFLEKWESVRDGVSVQLPEGLNAIQVLTIHKAKGLQFPLVIVPFADWQIQSGQDYEWVVMDKEELPVALVSTSKSVLEQTELEDIALSESQKSELDNLNLIYVAFTRAENELYVFYKEGLARNRISTLLHPVIKKHPGFSEDNGILEIGDKHVLKSTEPAEKPGLQIESFTPSELPEISFTGETKEEESEALTFGKALHSVFARSADLKSLRSVIGELPTEWDDSFRTKIISQVDRLLDNPEFNEVMSVPGEVLSETAILSSGDMYRPDRVVVNGKEACIIDFKTGEPSNRNRQQLETYANQLRQMGYSVAKKCLIYTRNGEVEYV